jgi:hypothetical protein
VLEGVFLPVAPRPSEAREGRPGGARILLRWRRPAGMADTWGPPLAALALVGAALLSGGAAGLAGVAVALTGVRLVGAWSRRRERVTLLRWLRRPLEAQAVVLDASERERLSGPTPAPVASGPPAGERAGLFG